MIEIPVTDARDSLAAVIERAQREPVLLTRRNRPVAAVVDVATLDRLIEAEEELDDIRAVDAAWAETERLAETPIPWDEVKRELGL